MIGFRALAVFAIGCTALDASVAAQTQSVCFQTSLPDVATNWQSTAVLPRFDSALGTLLSAEVTVTTHVQGSAAEESLDVQPTVVQLQWQATSTVTFPDGQVANLTVPTVTFNDSLTAFDGTVDFAGPSGMTHLGIVSTDTTITPVQDIVPFIGAPGAPDNVQLQVMGIGSSFVSGGGNVVSQFTASVGVDIQVCYTYAPDHPPVFVPPSPLCGSTFMVSEGLEITFMVCASDPDPNDTLTLMGTMPLGATTIPALPLTGNPVCMTVSWTPTPAQLGAEDFVFTAIDSHLQTAVCAFHELVPACFQFIGRGGSGSNVVLGGTSFPTFLDTVRWIYPVTMAQRPSIKIPDLATGQLDFSMQTLMHNPYVFPSNPDQWSNRLRVTILPGQQVLGQLFDTFNGIHQGLSMFTDPLGDRYLTFPFTIDGM